LQLLEVTGKGRRSGGSQSSSTGTEGASGGAGWREGGVPGPLKAVISESPVLRMQAGLTKAIHGAEGVFLMTPPNFDPEPGFPQTHKAAAAIRHAIETTRPGKIVFLSTVGAPCCGTQPSEQLQNYGRDATHYLGPDCFIACCLVHGKRGMGCGSGAQGRGSRVFCNLSITGFPMVAASDIARTAAELLNETWMGSPCY